jgi:excisionase family DNA binding protein
MLNERTASEIREVVKRLEKSGDTRGAEAIETLLTAVKKAAVPPLDYYTAPEAGNILGVSGQTIKNWVTQGRLQGYRIGSRIVVPTKAVEEYIRRAGSSLDLDDLTADEAVAVVAEGRPRPFYAKEGDTG